MFTEYKSTRAKKAPEELEAGKSWQVNARRLIIPLDCKAYGLSVRKWEEDGRKHHAITWKSKPYCKLLLNNKAGAKEFAQVRVNTEGKGLAVQVNPANLKECYISIPKGALEVFPQASCMLEYKRGKGMVYTLSAK